MPEEKPKHAQEEESGEGAPLWIISFADMISLLMAFFVMLTTFSTSTPAGTARIQRVGRMTLAPNYGWHTVLPAESVMPQILTVDETEQGSEKPTFEKDFGSSKIKQTPARDYSAYKVFLIRSNTVFWGAGTSISADGRKFLDAMASFLRRVPSRLVIAENGPDGDIEGGLLRAVSVVDYLAGKGVKKGSCNIAAQAILPQTNFAHERMLEISLLEKSIYK
jgi:hypothetical protein